MATLTPLSLADAQGLAARFGLDLAALEPLAAGSVNSNFALEMRDGTRYFARLYEEQPLAGAQVEVALLATLARRGARVVAPCETAQGERVLLHAGKPFAVFPWVDGDWLCLRRVNAAHCEAVGAELARVHAASSEVPPLSEGRFRPRDMLARLERVEREGPPRLAPALAEIRARYAEYLPKRDPELPRGICHGDLFRDNVLWQGPRISALLDFESVYSGSFAYDLMVTALAWCYTDSVVVPHVEAMFRGYASVRPLSAAEREALPVEGALACLRFATTRITDFELRAAPGQAPGRDYKRFLERLRALQSGAFDSAFQSLG
ncbi:MAG TPA: homoserine kinase [Polyangiaceae bacterium]|nr:homoserine kinase [Polyangiaceae bacterium]